MKSGSRILAFDDSSFKNGKSFVVGVVGRSRVIEGILSFYVDVDGSDATARLLKSISASRFLQQIRLVATNGITFAGLNLVDIGMAEKALGVPFIALTRKRPRKGLLRKAILNRPMHSSRLRLFDRLSKEIRVHKNGPYYVQHIGADMDDVRPMLDTAESLLRLAHIIASGVARGESRGRI